MCSELSSECQTRGLFLQVEMTVSTARELVAVKSSVCLASGREGMIVAS